MVDEVLRTARGLAQPACLLQRSFTRDASTVLAGSRSVALQSTALLSSSRSRTNALDSNWLLAGSVPSEFRHGMVNSLKPADPHGQKFGIVSTLAAVPQSVQITCVCVLIMAMLGYMLCGRSRHDRHSTRTKGFGICFHVVVISISGFLRGYVLYIIGPFITPIQRSLQLCYPCAGSESDLALATCSCPWKEFAVSSVALGAIFGCLLGGVAADAIGRRLTLIASNVLFIVSSLMMGMSGAGAWSPLFFIGRGLAGLAVGASGPASHAYISEIVPTRYRGQLLASTELALIVGVFTVFGFAAALGDERWREAMQFPAVPALLQLGIIFFCLHESPRWLAANGETEEAQHVMESLGLEPPRAEPIKTPAAHTIQLPLSSLRPSCRILTSSFEKPPRSGLAILLHHRRRVLLAIGCALAHNALGANIVMYYSRDILQLANIGNSVGTQMSLGAAKTLGTGAAFAAVDRCGRRSLLIIGTIGAIMGHFGLALAFMPGAVQFSSWLAWSSLLLFLAAWDLGWASLMSVVISEVLPDDVRGLGLGASCSLFWLVSFVQAQTLETLFKQITIAGTFAVYCIASIVGLVFVAIYVPETCGQPLEKD